MTKKRTPRIWGSQNRGYWVCTGRYGRGQISPTFVTQDKARLWRDAFYPTAEAERIKSERR